MYWMPTEMLLRMPASVIGRSGWKSSSCFAVTCTSGRWRVYWLGCGMCWSNTAFATGPSPGWATQVPSQPSVTSRSLSARTFSIAASFAAGSFLIGICAAMPPIAGAPRRWRGPGRPPAGARRVAPPVAGRAQQRRVGAHERRGHRHLRAVGKAEILVGAEFLDAGKDVVPAPDIQARRVVAQLVQDLLHLERGHQRFDQ